MSANNKEKYRWLIVAACTCICFYTMGLTYNMFTLFQTGIEAETGMDRAQSSAILSIIMGMASVGSLLAGRIYSGRSIRNGAVIFGILMGAGYMLMVNLRSMILIYLMAAIMGISYGAGSMAASYNIVNNWYAKRNGFITGIVSMGSGIATFLCPPIINGLIENEGIRTAMFVHGGVIIVLVLLTRIVIRDDPASKGMKPYGIDEWEPVEKTGPGYEKVKKSKRFFGVVVLSGAYNGCALPLLGQFSPIIREAGHSAALSAAAISILGISMMISKPLFGALNDRLGLMRSFYTVIAVQIMAMICLFLLGSSKITVLILAVLMGYMIAVTSVGPGVWIRNLFGSRDYEKSFGITLFTVFISISAFLLIGGFLRNSTGSYTIVFLMDCILSLIIIAAGILVFKGANT